MGPFFALLSSFTWAVGVTAYSKLSERHPGYRINFTRALIALPILLTLSLFESGGLRQAVVEFQRVQSSQLGWFAVSVLASYAVGDILFLLASRALGVPAALAIASSYPLWAALAGKLFRGEHLGTVKFLGLLLVVSGTVTVITAGFHKLKHQAKLPEGLEHAKMFQSFSLGVVLALLVSFLWALNTFAIAQSSWHTPSSVINSCRMALALILVPIFGIPISKRSARVFVQLIVPWKDLRGNLWAFIIESCGGSTLFVYGMTHSRLAIGAALSSLAPAIAVPLAWVLGTEKPSLAKTAGVLAVTAGVILLVN